MLIELHGGQFRNKGAQKMLLTAMTALREQVVGARFAVDTVYADAATMRACELHQIWPRRGWISGRHLGHRLLLQRLADFLPSGILGECRVRARDVDAWVDLAGFAYSDQWGTYPCTNIGKLVSHLRKSGKPIVFLPQALGPFEHPANAAGFRAVLEQADLVYARDFESLQYCKSLAANTSNLRLAPDITLFQDARFEPAALPSDAHAYVVPNIQMLKRRPTDWRDRYVSLLARSIELLSSHGISPRLLIHDEGSEDRRLALEIKRESGDDIPIVDETDPWKIKRLIGESTLVIGSRYHALIAALSKGVPVIALGWSHKYDSLLADFEMQRFAISASAQAVDAAIEELCFPENNESARTRICKRLSALARINQQMWRDVGELLRSR